MHIMGQPDKSVTDVTDVDEHKRPDASSPRIRECRRAEPYAVTSVVPARMIAKQNRKADDRSYRVVTEVMFRSVLSSKKCIYYNTLL